MAENSETLAELRAERDEMAGLLAESLMFLAAPREWDWSGVRVDPNAVASLYGRIVGALDDGADETAKARLAEAHAAMDARVKEARLAMHQQTAAALALPIPEDPDLPAAFEPSRNARLGVLPLPQDCELVWFSEAVGRVAARGNRDEGWTIETATVSFIHCRNGMASVHDGTITVVKADAGSTS